MAWVIPFLLFLAYAFFGITGDNHVEVLLTNANIWLAVAYIVSHK